jgi:hypothetical protein
MSEDETRKLLIELVNAGFDCGAFPEEDMLKSDAYEKLRVKGCQLTDEIHTLITSLRTRLDAAEKELKKKEECSCASRAPTYPTYREFEHFPDCSSYSESPAHGLDKMFGWKAGTSSNLLIQAVYETQDKWLKKLSLAAGTKAGNFYEIADQIHKLKEANAELVKDKDRLDKWQKFVGSVVSWSINNGEINFNIHDRLGNLLSEATNVRQAIDDAIAKGTQ